MGTHFVPTRCSEFTFDAVGKTKNVLPTLQILILFRDKHYARSNLQRPLQLLVLLDHRSRHTRRKFTE